MGGGQPSAGIQSFANPDTRMSYRPVDTGDDIKSNRRVTGGDRKVYDAKELQSLLDALDRIGISDLANPPTALGKRYQPVDYKLPQYPPSLPEDTVPAF